MLYLLLALTIVLLPNALHVSINTGIPGLNFSNLLFIALVVVLLFSTRSASPRQQPPAKLGAPLLLFFAILGLGYFMAGPSDVMTPLEDVTRLKNAIFYPLLYFVFRHCKQDLARTRQLITLVVIVAVVAAVEAVMQGMSYGIGEYVETQRATGPFGDANMANRAGVFYAMFLPLLAAIAVFDRRKMVRVASVVGCVLLAGAILLTYSRQSYLIALLGLLILLMHRSIAATLLASVLLVATVSYLPASVVQRVEETRRVDATGAATVDNSTASRLEIWEGAFKMWKENPGGVGLGRFTTHIGDYAPEYHGRDAHNAYVLIWAELGLIGVLVVFWLLWRMWSISRFVRRASPPGDSEGHAIALGFKITVFSMALSNVYGSPFYEGLIMASFWILCGLVERYGVLKAATATAQAPAPAHGMWPMARVVDRFPLAARTMPGLGGPSRLPQN